MFHIAETNKLYALHIDILRLVVFLAVNSTVRGSDLDSGGQERVCGIAYRGRLFSNAVAKNYGDIFEPPESGV